MIIVFYYEDTPLRGMIIAPIAVQKHYFTAYIVFKFELMSRKERVDSNKESILKTIMTS